MMVGTSFEEDEGIGFGRVDNAKIMPKNSKRPSKLLENCELIMSPQNHHKQGNHQTKTQTTSFSGLQEYQNCTQGSSINKDYLSFTVKLGDFSGNRCNQRYPGLSAVAGLKQSLSSKFQLIGLSSIPFQWAGGLKPSFPILKVVPLDSQD